jgi:hypothetical protein
MADPIDEAASAEPTQQPDTTGTTDTPDPTDVADPSAAGTAEPGTAPMPTGAAERGRSKVRKRVGLGVAAAVLVAAGAVTATQLVGSSGSGGAGSPQEAVEEMVTALEASDVLGLLDVADPGERNALLRFAQGLETEGERLELVGEAFELSGLPGVGLDFEGLQFEVEDLDVDLAAVHVVAGTVTGSFDPATFPIGRTLDWVEASPGSGTTDLTDVMNNDGTDVMDLMVVTVERDGRWYVSLGYTVAEFARRGAGLETPERGATIPAEGFATPQEAGDAFLTRLASLDLRGTVALAAPGEGDVWRRYLPLVLPEAQRGLDAARGEGMALTVSGIQWDVQEEGDRAVARLTGVTVEGMLPASALAEDEYSDANLSGDFPPFDPTQPTLIQFIDGTAILLPAGSPEPTTAADIEGDPQPMFDVADQLPADVLPNVAMVIDGELEVYWSTGPPAPEPVVEPEPSTEPVPFRVVLADGCVTMDNNLAEAGDISPDPSDDLDLSILGLNAEEVDGGMRICFTDDDSESFAFVTLMTYGLLGPELPPVELVRDDGRWYVSPLGTSVTSVLGLFRQVDTGKTGWNSLLGFFTYPVQRDTLKYMLEAESASDIGPECAPLVVIEDDEVIDVVQDATREAVNACWETVLAEEDGWFSYPADGDPDFEVTATTAWVLEGS